MYNVYVYIKIYTIFVPCFISGNNSLHLSAILSHYNISKQYPPTLRQEGRLEFSRRNRAPLNWYKIMGHKGPVN